MKENDIQAFPLDFENSQRLQKGYPIESRWLGMTLRDYFANSAMLGITTKIGYNAEGYDKRAKLAYEIADAMLKERKIKNE
jgi:hypothetical protein